MPVVKEIHVVCRQGMNVENETATHFDTGHWVIAPLHARTDGTVTIALHEEKQTPSYLQGVIEELLPTVEEQRIMLRVRKSPEPLPWKGGGSGEKGYLWEGGEFSGLPVVPVILSRWVKAGANEPFRSLVESASWEYPTLADLGPDAKQTSNAQAQFENIVMKIATALDSPDVPYAFSDASEIPYRLDDKRIRYAVANEMFMTPVASAEGRVRSLRITPAYWAAKAGLREALRSQVLAPKDSGTGSPAPAGATTPLPTDAFAGNTLDPIDPSAARRILRTSVAVRLGQASFREAVGRAYGWRCAITGTKVRPTLQAAHIVPYEIIQESGNHMQNGIMLRADLHLLFDCGQIGLRYEGDELKVTLHNDLMTSGYATFSGRSARLPLDPAARPSRTCVQKRMEIDAASEYPAEPLPASAAS